MKAFMSSIVALVVITGAAAVIFGNGISESSREAFTSENANVRH